MNNADIQTELERIMAQTTSIKELADKNSEKIQKLIDEARVASNEGDTEMYLTLMNEATARLKQSEMYMKLLEETANDARRLLVTAYGPVGGAIFDAIVRKQKEEMGS